MTNKQNPIKYIDLEVVKRISERIVYKSRSLCLWDRLL